MDSSKVSLQVGSLRKRIPEDLNIALDYIETKPARSQEILMYLLGLFSSFPGVTIRMSYGIPYFYGKTWLCYLYVLKNGDVEVGFTRGHLFPNPFGLLQSRGRKIVSSVVFSQLEDIPEGLLIETFKDALVIDQSR